MGDRAVGNGRKSDVFVDMCTQRDYLIATGAQPALNSSQVLPMLKRLMAFVRWARVPMLSCVDVQRPSDVRGLPRAHCVQGTAGQRKLPFTMLPDHVHIDSDNCLCISLDLLQTHQQLILVKEHRDPFTNPKLDRLLTELPIRRFVVFGVALETSVRLLVLGLLLRNRRVAVVWDACAWWNAGDGDMALRQMVAKGCELVTTGQLVESAVSTYKRNGQQRYGRRSVA
jgi:nicotinamidase-related amidase